MLTWRVLGPKKLVCVVGKAEAKDRNSFFTMGQQLLKSSIDAPLGGPRSSFADSFLVWS